METVSQITDKLWGIEKPTNSIGGGVVVCVKGLSEKSVHIHLPHQK